LNKTEHVAEKVFKSTVVKLIVAMFTPVRVTTDEKVGVNVFVVVPTSGSFPVLVNELSGVDGFGLVKTIFPCKGDDPTSIVKLSDVEFAFPNSNSKLEGVNPRTTGPT